MLAQELPRSEKGYLIESFWKFLLYTELAKTAYDQMLSKPVYYVRTDIENEFCGFVDEYQSVIMPEFSVRLEAVVARLRNLPVATSTEVQRLNISERLHSEMLPRLRNLLGKLLNTKAKVAILVDNLDKAWNQHTNLQLLSELLFGLLGVSSRVAQEFAKEGHWRDPVNLYLTLFLRSDIHAAMIRLARERDKLPIRLITWDDPEMLRRVVEERFVNSGADVVRPDDIWDRYFPPTVCGIPTRDYLADSVLPKPRDLIYLVKAALQVAVNRGHARIEEKDLLTAEQQYSRFALDSLLVEGSARIPKLDEIIFELVGSFEIITADDLQRATLAAGLPRGSDEVATDTLVELTFLGPEVGLNRFTFLYDEDSATKLQVMARKTALEHGTAPVRYRINKPFHAYLEVKTHPSLPPGQLAIDLQPGVERV
jgi:hypothetical protein